MFETWAFSMCEGVNLSSDWSGSAIAKHPSAPGSDNNGSAYGLNILTSSSTKSSDATINLSLSEITTNEILVSYATGLTTCVPNDNVLDILKRKIVPNGYVVSELTLNITKPLIFDFVSYLAEYNASITNDVTLVNLYIDYSVDVVDFDTSVTVTKTVCIHYVIS